MLVSEVQARVQRTFGDMSSIQVITSDIINWVNDAQKAIVAGHGDLLLTTSDTDLVASQREYAVPPSAYNIHSLLCLYTNTNGVYYPLENLTLSEVNLYLTGYATSSFIQGCPQFYSRAPHQNFFSIYPTSDTSVAQALRLTYSKYAAPIAAVTDALEVPQYYDNTVVDYCLMRAYELDENWDAHGVKAQSVENSIAFNSSKEAWFERQTYPTITTDVLDLY